MSHGDCSPICEGNSGGMVLGRKNLTCCLHLPGSRQSPSPSSSESNKTQADASSTNAARKVGLSLAAITRAQWLCASLCSQHRNHKAPVKLSGIRLKEEGQYDPRTKCSDLPRMLWSPDVFMGFKRLQVHSRSKGIARDGRTQPLLWNCENNLWEPHANNHVIHALSVICFSQASANGYGQGEALSWPTTTLSFLWDCLHSGAGDLSAKDHLSWSSAEDHHLLCLSELLSLPRLRQTSARLAAVSK